MKGRKLMDNPTNYKKTAAILLIITCALLWLALTLEVWLPVLLSSVTWNLTVM